MSAAGSDPEAVDRWLTALVAEDTDGEPRLGGTSNRLVCKILSMALEDAVDVVALLGTQWRSLSRPYLL